MQTEKTATRLLQNMVKQANSSATYKVSPKAVVHALLLSEESFATTLLLLVADRYGLEVLQWAPETIRLELEADYQLRLPKITIDKIMAAITLVTTNFFYKDVSRFIELCNILAGDDFQPDEFEPADSEEILMAVIEAMLLWPPDDDPEDTEFSSEIREYMSQVLGEEGIVKPFDVLRLALDGDQSSFVDTEYADDPEMYSAIYASQQGKTDNMKASLMENINALIQQLKLLQLANGNTDQVISHLQQIADAAGITGET